MNQLLCTITARIKLLLAIAISCIASTAGAQISENQQLIDSLHKELKSSTDTTRSFLLSFISDVHFEEDNTDSAFFYAREAMALARRYDWQQGIMEGFFQLGDLYLSKIKDFDTAMVYFDSLYVLSRSLKDTNYIARSHLYKGLTYDNAKKFSEALKHYFSLLTIARGQKDKSLEVSALVNIGNIYGMTEQSEKALDYYEDAVAINNELGNKYDEALLLINMSSEYATLEKYDKAIQSSKTAIDILNELEDEHLIAFTRGNMGGIYTDMKAYNEALKSFKTAVQYFREQNDNGYIADNLGWMGILYLEVYFDSTGYKTDKSLFPATKVGNLEKAIACLEEALKMYEDGAVEDIYGHSGTYEELARAYEAAGRLPEAYAALKSFNKLKDSVLAQEDDKKIAQLEGERIIKLKDHELELQNELIKKKKQERWYLIGGIALLAIGLGVIFRNYRQRGIANRLLSAEKKKSEELLLNILPEEVAEELKDKGSADAMHYDEVTVLFTDFVNFTDAGERMTSQELVDELDACFRAFDEITEKYDIEKIKTIGDAYLAVCGMPAADKDHAEKVVQAATEIITYMMQRKEKLGDKTFEIRIGIHSGDVVAGIVGVKKFAYDIWGDTVNTAARMEQNSEPGKINISQTTYDLVKDKFTCTYRGEHDAKNKGKLKMYFVEAGMA